MKKLIATVGIPASGKTTWAKEQVVRFGPQTCRANKDEIRLLIHAGSEWSREKEHLTFRVQQNMIRTLLRSSVVETVIVDDTNLNPKVVIDLDIIARQEKADFELKFFDDSLDLDLCLERNRNREAFVPEHVIKDMHSKYQKMLDKYGR